jgi:menaquinone-specific isochorismate synthase
VNPVLNKSDPRAAATRPVPGKSPWDCLMEIRDEIEGSPTVVWESPDGASFAGVGAAYRVEVTGPGRFEEARARLEAIFESNGNHYLAAIGGFSFETDGLFFVPQRTYCKTSAFRETREIRLEVEEVPAARAPDVPDEPAPWERPEWNDAVRRTLDRIREGSLTKAVLARSLVIPVGRGTRALDLLATLREMYPTCYRFLLDDGRGRAFLGASPERLVKLEDARFDTEAVAGTQRCEPGDDTEAMARKLLARAKDQREHQVVLRHILQAVSPVAMEVRTSEAEVIRLPHLMHLRTRIHGVRQEKSVLGFVSRLHPTPAVAGWPRAAALDWIRRTEPSPRGWYAGCVGWVDTFGDGDFAVGIRSIALHGDRARVFAGAGIVEGSDPEQEWHETELKMKGILDAIARD